jgi:uncharacterized UPF0146 family protein
VSEPIVNVSAPVVHVAAPVVNQESTVVNVDMQPVVDAVTAASESVDRVRDEIAKPTVALFDADGNVIGSKKQD